MLIHRLFYTATTTNPNKARTEFIQLLRDKGYSQELIDTMLSQIFVVNSCLIDPKAHCTLDTWYREQ